MTDQSPQPGEKHRNQPKDEPQSNTSRTEVETPSTPGGKEPANPLDVNADTREVRLPKKTSDEGDRGGLKGSSGDEKDRSSGVEEDAAEDDSDDEDEEEDEQDGDSEDDEEEDEEDEEPRLKYARLTPHLNGVYRNGDATSTFLVAGDKMVGISVSISRMRTNLTVDSRITQW